MDVQIRRERAEAEGREYVALRSISSQMLTWACSTSRRLVDLTAVPFAMALCSVRIRLAALEPQPHILHPILVGPAIAAISRISKAKQDSRVAKQ